MTDDPELQLKQKKTEASKQADQYAKKKKKKKSQATGR